jgi:hypothetical protein
MLSICTSTVRITQDEGVAEEEKHFIALDEQG